jgi:hypothetical protein
MSSNQTQPRPKDTVDEKTIERNLEKMDYDPKEDIMRQDEEVDADLENSDKQASSAEQLVPRSDS